MAESARPDHIPRFDSLIAAVRHFGGEAAEVVAQEPAPGGCINNGFSLTLKDGRRCFVKMNRRSALDMFRQEALGLGVLRSCARASGSGLEVPGALSLGTDGDHAFMVLEYLPPVQSNDDYWIALGHGLAILHERSTRELFGFDMDNYIGSNPQRNSWDESWPEFFARQRLKPQLDLARRQLLASDALSQAVESIIKRIDSLIPQLPMARLVHGDLWSGNIMAVAGAGGARAALIDPAVYWGDSRVDLAMTELFGGFPATFYSAYREVRDPGSEYRSLRGLYNLYHLLNHLNLMGKEYAADALRTAQSFA